MANNAPVEILTEILRPLLKHSDAAFSDTSEKPLLAVRGFEVSSYLLVNKAWLRASTPLLYSVVILRTTVQAVALERVLKRYPDMGNYILKLRVEGGFGMAMHIILKCATRLRELFISLVIATSDDVAGLCSGLPLVNPDSVYIHDKNYIGRGNGFSRTPKVDKLLRTVVSFIPKWSNLKLFHFPYFPVYLMGGAVHRVLDPRAEKLVSGLALSQTLETVLLYTGVSVPAYLSQLLSSPRLKTLRFRRGLAYSRYRKEIQNHPELSLYADFPQSEIDATTKAESDRGIQDTHGYYSDPDSDENVILLHAFAPNPADSDDHSTVTEDNLELIQDLGKRCGNTLKSLSAGGAMLYYNNRKKDVQVLSLTIFSDFTALTKLSLLVPLGDGEPWLTNPSKEFCKTLFPNLESLDLSRMTRQTVDLFSELHLPSLHTVKAAAALSRDKTLPDAMTWNAFLSLHGSKLRSLEISPCSVTSGLSYQWVKFLSPAEDAMQTQLRIFELCPNLCDVSFGVGVRMPREGSVVAPEKPYNSLTRMCFEITGVAPTKKEEVALRSFFLRLLNPNGVIDWEAIENKMFPALREVKFTSIRWPTSKYEIIFCCLTSGKVELSSLMEDQTPKVELLSYPEVRRLKTAESVK